MIEAAVVEMETRDEPDLISLAAGGDEEAFTVLFRRYFPMISSYTYKLALNSAVSEDLAQSTFVKAARNLTRFRSGTNFKSWLFAIATNCYRDLLRKQRRDSTLQEELTLQAANNSPDRPYDAVYEALRQLSPAQREVVALVYFENLSHREVARLLGCAETTISWRLCLARRSLKKLLHTQE